MLLYHPTRKIYFKKESIFHSLTCYPFNDIMSIENFCKNLKYYREKKGLSQDRLARLSNIPYSTYVKIESLINKNPSLDSVIKISKALDISIDTLVYKKPRPFKK